MRWGIAMVKQHSQLILILSFLPFCWLAMMAIHELGHVLSAWLTGGTVTKVVLHPLAISRTDVSPNPKPLIVAWSGPVIGITLPILIWGFFSTVRLPGAPLARFFAGFCLVANGAYIGIGSLEKIGDAGEMLRHGAPIWTLWIFGGLAVPAGFVIWNGLGPHFGFGQSNGQVDALTAYVCLGLLIALAIAGFAFSSRL